MFKPTATLAATLAALAFPVLGTQAAVAAPPAAALPLPATEPTPTAGEGNDDSEHDDMAGMDHDTMAGHDDDMAGMDHGEATAEADHHDEQGSGEATAEPSGHSTAGMTDEEMPGMDHGDSSGGDHDEPSAPGGRAGGSHGHVEEESVAEPRPVELLVGGFAVVNGAVLVSAAALRRRDAGSRSRSPRPARPAK